MKIKPYEQYKETNLPWLDKVPLHWKVERAKNVFKIIDVRSKTGDQELLSVTSNYGVVKRKNTNVTMFMAESYIGYKLCWKRDLVVNSLWAWQRGIGFSNFHGIISTAYSVYRFRNESDYNYKYFNYLLRSQDYLWELRVRSKGIWRSRYQLHDQSFMGMPIVIPSRDEQDCIVKFLDSKLAKIDNFINTKKKLISVLKEQKQAVINNVVTKGLDPNVKMKHSGIEGLGKIPEHWEVRPLKNYVRSNIESLSNNFGQENEIEYIDISSVGFGELKSKPVRYKFKDAPSRARRIVNYGDTIISTVRTYLRSMCFVDEQIENCIVSTGFAVLTPNKVVYPKFLNYTLSSNYFVNLVSKNSIGVSYPAISESKLVSLKIVLPKTISEQQEILTFITNQTNVYDKSIIVAEKQIKLMSEYRTRLISDVVTGKVDIRNIQITEVHIEENEVGDCEGEIIADAGLESEECEV